MTTAGGQTPMQVTLTQYLLLRNRLGHELADAARLLPRFVDYLDEVGHTTITIADALAWCQQPPAPPGSSVWPRRMGAVRGFARYLSGIDPATEVPPAGLLPSRRRWRPPYLYSPDEITALLDAAAALPSPQRAATFSTLFGLLAATGMRVGEALTLDIDDIDWDLEVVLVRESKFGKSRNVPLSDSTAEALRRYAHLRKGFERRPGNDSFFVSLTGRRVIYESVFDAFDHLRRSAALGNGATVTPRIHDLRHTFAVTVLMQWYSDGGDVAVRLPRLSTYLGHRDPRSTYWYLSAAPQLLALAARRLEPTPSQVIS